MLRKKQSEKAKPKTNKEQLGKVKKELIKKADLYRKLTGVSRVKLTEELLEEFFKDRILTNDFIELEKPYYFNMTELKTNGSVKASAVKPIKDLEKTYIMFNVPNNLDTWNKDLNSYCFEDNTDLHRGYYIFNEFEEPLELVFSYNVISSEIEIAVSNDRSIYFTEEQKEIKKNPNNTKEIYIPELDTASIIAASNSFNCSSYSDYKYFELEKDQRFKEDVDFIEKSEAEIEAELQNLDKD